MAFDFGWLCKISHTKITNSRRKCSREAVHCNCVAVLSPTFSFVEPLATLRPCSQRVYTSWLSRLSPWGIIALCWDETGIWRCKPQFRVCAWSGRRNLQHLSCSRLLWSLDIPVCVLQQFSGTSFLLGSVASRWHLVHCLLAVGMMSCLVSALACCPWTWCLRHCCQVDTTEFLLEWLAMHFYTLGALGFSNAFLMP